MKHSARAIVLSSLISVLVHAACSDAGTSPEVAQLTQPTSGQVVTDGRLGGLETHFAQISEAVPEFAGYYYEGEELVVGLTDVSKGPQVRTFTNAVAERKHDRGQARATVFREAQFTFTELRLYRDIATANAGDRGGVRYIDLDEVNNKVVVAVRSREDLLALEPLGRTQGIPEDAIEYAVATGPLVPHIGRADLTHDNLRTRLDTVYGGAQGKHDSNGSCTIWVGATQGTNEVLLTASHCDADGFADQKNGTLYQRLSGAADTIGDEIKDPSSTCTVPSGAMYNAGSTDCRWADAALYDATNLSRFQKGWVAWVNNRSGGLKIVHDSMNTISGEVAYPVVNDEVQMVGQTSGWRVGDVVKTCVMVFYWEDDYTLRCQEFADYVAGGGDSGAPIFIGSIGYGEKEMIGMHIGGQMYGDTAIFSSMNNIEVDLGLLEVRGPPVLESRVPGERVRTGNRE